MHHAIGFASAVRRPPLERPAEPRPNERRLEGHLAAPEHTQGERALSRVQRGPEQLAARIEHMHHIATRRGWRLEIDREHPGMPRPHPGGTASLTFTVGSTPLA